MKYVVVTGGVVSGLGKGITISSLGVLLKAAGLRVTSVKIDPYLNSDAGTMSPFEHGEVFVLNDGGEADLDLGNYERFLDITLTKDHNITTGKVYSQVIECERRGDYLGKTVQVIPHVTDAIQEWIERVAHLSVDGMAGPPDVCLVEVGGTVGDIESLVFLEALRQFRTRVGPENTFFFHVSLVPVLGAVGEQKTKPTQHSVKELRSVGISPDAIVCRSSKPLAGGTRRKLGHFCQVPTSHVLAVHDVSNIYHVPLLLQEQNAASIMLEHWGMEARCSPPSLTSWCDLAARVDSLASAPTVHIALVGKYTGLSDSYLSVIKSLKHAAVAAGQRLVIEWIDAASLEHATSAAAPGAGTSQMEATAPGTAVGHGQDSAYEQCWATLKRADGILVPGGFGDRGVEGKILAIQYARENQVPFLGICLGMQCAVLEFARNVLGVQGATSTEFDPDTPNPVVLFMPEINQAKMGGTMRLGNRTTVLKPRPDGKGSLAEALYGKVRGINERHRHRYEVNPDYVPGLVEKGLLFTGTDERSQRMEIVELGDQWPHPFFFAVQYHPEFNSHPYRPSPPFMGLILAASGQLQGNLPLPHAKDALANYTHGAASAAAAADGMQLLSSTVVGTAIAQAAAKAATGAAEVSAGIHTPAAAPVTGVVASPTVPAAAPATPPRGALPTPLASEPPVVGQGTPASPPRLGHDDASLHTVPSLAPPGVAGAAPPTPPPAVRRELAGRGQSTYIACDVFLATVFGAMQGKPPASRTMRAAVAQGKPPGSPPRGGSPPLGRRRTGSVAGRRGELRPHGSPGGGAPSSKFAPGGAAARTRDVNRLLETIDSQMAAVRSQRYTRRATRAAALLTPLPEGLDEVDIEVEEEACVGGLEAPDAGSSSRKGASSKVDLKVALNWAEQVHPRVEVGTHRVPLEICSTQLGRHCCVFCRWCDPCREGIYSELEAFGPAVSMFFKDLKCMALVFLVLSALAVPTILLNVTLGTGAVSPTVLLNARFTDTMLGNLGSPVVSAGNASALNGTSNVETFQLALDSVGVCGVAERNEAVRALCSLGEGDIAGLYVGLDVAVMLLFWLLYCWWRVFQRRENWLVDRDFVSAGDYTVFVRGIPNEVDELTLKSHFEEVIGEAVASVSIARDEKEYTRLAATAGVMLRRWEELAAATAKQVLVDAAMQRGLAGASEVMDLGGPSDPAEPASAAPGRPGGPPPITGSPCTRSLAGRGRAPPGPGGMEPPSYGNSSSDLLGDIEAAAELITGLKVTQRVGVGGVAMPGLGAREEVGGDESVHLTFAEADASVTARLRTISTIAGQTAGDALEAERRTVLARLRSLIRQVRRARSMHVGVLADAVRFNDQELLRGCDPAVVRAGAATAWRGLGATTGAFITFERQMGKLKALKAYSNSRWRVCRVFCQGRALRLVPDISPRMVTSAVKRLARGGVRRRRAASRRQSQWDAILARSSSTTSKDKAEPSVEDEDVQRVLQPARGSALSALSMAAARVPVRSVIQLESDSESDEERSSPGSPPGSPGDRSVLHGAQPPKPRRSRRQSAVDAWATAASRRGTGRGLSLLPIVTTEGDLPPPRAAEDSAALHASGESPVLASRVQTAPAVVPQSSDSLEQRAIRRSVATLRRLSQRWHTGIGPSGLLSSLEAQAGEEGGGGVAESDGAARSTESKKGAERMAFAGVRARKGSSACADGKASPPPRPSSPVGRSKLGALAVLASVRNLDMPPPSSQAHTTVGTTMASASSRRLVVGKGEPDRLTFTAKQRRRRTSTLEVLRASVPFFVQWSNLSVSWWSRLLRGSLTTLLLVSGLTLSFTMTAATNEALASAAGRGKVDICPVAGTPISDEALEADPNLLPCYCRELDLPSALTDPRCSGWVEAATVGMGVTLASSVTMAGVNVLLQFVILALTPFEAHWSKDAEQLSLTWRLFVSLFFNTALIQLLVTTDWNALFGLDLGFNSAADGRLYADLFSPAWYANVGSVLCAVMAFNVVAPHMLPLSQLLLYSCQRKWATRRPMWTCWWPVTLVFACDGACCPCLCGGSARPVCPDLCGGICVCSGACCCFVMSCAACGSVQGSRSRAMRHGTLSRGTSRSSSSDDGLGIAVDMALKTSAAGPSPTSSSRAALDSGLASGGGNAMFGRPLRSAGEDEEGVEMVGGRVGSGATHVRSPLHTDSTPADRRRRRRMTPPTGIGLDSSVMEADLAGPIMRVCDPVCGACVRRLEASWFDWWAPKSQRQLNAIFTGPEFPIIQRYSAILTTVFATLMYSSGIPLMYLLALVSFLLFIALDKALLLRFYRNPLHYDSLQISSLSGLIPAAIVLHCIIAAWAFTNDAVFPTRGDSVDVLLVPAPDLVNSLRALVPLNVNIVERLTRAHVLPMLGLAVLVVFVEVVVRGSVAVADGWRRRGCSLHKARDPVHAPYSQLKAQKRIKGMSTYNILEGVELSERLNLPEHFTDHFSSLSDVLLYQSRRMEQIMKWTSFKVQATQRQHSIAKAKHSVKKAFTAATEEDI